MALDAVNVTKQFFRKRGTSNVFYAVENVTLTIPDHEICVITGPSGSGKSTLLNMMAGILAPTEGTVRIGDTDLYGMNDDMLSLFRNEHIGVVPQGQTAIHSLTVMDNVLLPWTLYKGKKKSLREKEGRTVPDDSAVLRRAEMLLEKTGIRDLADVMPSEISGGEMRRMAVARALIMRPEVILADEPTADLDEENTKTVLGLLRYAAEEGSAVMVVTHDKDVIPWADRVFNLDRGRLT